MHPERPRLPEQPHRRPAKGGYPRGDETRERVIRVATGLFARHGFDGVSTRAIASAAGVNAPALQYYFDSKRGLYRACAEAIMTSIWSRLRPRVEEVERQLAENQADGELIASYCRLQDCLVDSFFTEEEGLSVEPMLRHEATGAGATEAGVTDARDLMRINVSLRLFDMFKMLMGHILGSAPDSLEIGLHAFAVSGLFMVFNLDGTRIRDALDWAPSDEAALTLLKSILREQATTLLTGLATARDQRKAASSPR